MLRRALGFVLMCSISLSTLAISSTGPNVLVVLEPKIKKNDYSLFFNGLEERGFNLTFKGAKEDVPALTQHKVPSFSHVILFAPTTRTLSSDLTSRAIVSLLSANPPVNFLIALSPTSTQLSTLAAEFSLSLSPPNMHLISHFPPREGPRNLVPVTIPERPSYAPKLPPVLTKTDTPILFSGVPHYLGDNPLLVEILRAPPESFAADTESDKGGSEVYDAAENGGEGVWAGSSLGLVTGFQTRTGGRVVFSGGAGVFSDDYAQTELDGRRPFGNAQFARDVSAWVFQESLQLRVDSATHYRQDDVSKTQRDRYTVNDQVLFTMHVSAWDPEKGKWFDAPRMDDIQLEFTMLDPHIRTVLFPVVNKPGEFSVSFRVPDRHGVFKFVVDYRRKGFSSLYYSGAVSVVPKRHDEYDRFLSAAWPYYAGALSTSIGFIVFTVIYLGGEVDRRLKGKGKSTKVE